MSAIEGLTAGEIRTYCQVRIPKLTKQGDELRAPCPVHHGSRLSFSINPENGMMHCHSECGRGWDLVGLEEEITGVDFKTALTEVRRIIGRENGNQHHHRTNDLGPIVATYDYTDESGKLLFQVTRHDPKDFRQRRPDGHGGWIPKIEGLRRVLFHLPELAGAENVFVTEGEKDVLALERLGITATCNPGGASKPGQKSKWRQEYSETLRGRNIVVLPDNDEPGRYHAQQVAEALKGYARSVRIVDLTGVPEKGDISDWIAAGGTREALLEMVAMATEYAGIAADGESDTGTPIRSITDIPPISACGSTDIVYVQKPLLVEKSISALTGEAGSGKSSVALAIAGDVARTGRCVLILDRENPLPIIAERYARFHIEDNGTIRHWGGWLREEAPTPGSAMVLEWVRRSDPKPLIVIDSMIAFHGGDENSAGETRAFIQQCRTLADMGASVLLLHHTGKADSAKDYRGSSDFKAAIDQGFQLSNSSLDGRLETLRLRCFKSRFGFMGELIYYYRDGQFIRDDREDAPIRTAQEQLSDLLRANPGVTGDRFEVLANDSGLGRNRARQFLNDGMAAGLVRLQKGPGNRRTYSLESGSSEVESEFDFK